MSEKPLIFIIDIDGCLVGDIIPQIMLYELIAELKHNHAKIPFNIKEFEYKLKHGLVRPHFQSFFKTMKKYIPYAEFYIYTASQKQWATFLINHIEKALNIKFNRPLFTRENCIIINGEYKKSIKNIRPIILRNLKKKYNIHDLDKRILMIDNTNVFSKQEQNLLLICQTYKYKRLENIPSILTEKIYNNHKDVILNILTKYIGDISGIYEEFEKQYYTYYIKQNNYINELNDKFWYRLAKLMITKNIKQFSEKAVIYLNRKINETTTSTATFF